MAASNGRLDVDDDHQVRWALLRLAEIARELHGVNERRAALYDERMALVDTLRGVVPQHQLAAVCDCGVDMIKNISAKASRLRRVR